MINSKQREIIDNYVQTRLNEITESQNSNDAVLQMICELEGHFTFPSCKVADQDKGNKSNAQVKPRAFIEGRDQVEVHNYERHRFLANSGLQSAEEA